MREVPDDHHDESAALRTPKRAWNLDLFPATARPGGACAIPVAATILDLFGRGQKLGSFLACRLTCAFVLGFEGPFASGGLSHVVAGCGAAVL